MIDASRAQVDDIEKQECWPILPSFAPHSEQLELYEAAVVSGISTVSASSIWKLIKASTTAFPDKLAFAFDIVSIFPAAQLMLMTGWRLETRQVCLASS